MTREANEIKIEVIANDIKYIVKGLDEMKESFKTIEEKYVSKDQLKTVKDKVAFHSKAILGAVSILCASILTPLVQSIIK